MSAPKSKRILLTGGAGFIGSHTYLALVQSGYEVTILDNFLNAQKDVPDRLGMILGSKVDVIDADICDPSAIDAAMAQGFDGVVHFAALKSIPEGEADPLGYYQTNCAGLMNVVSAMRAHDVRSIVFSSSAATYGANDQMPIDENAAQNPINVYARTKVFGEQFLNAISAANPEFHVGILRYFNPVGAHSSGLIGEDPELPPTNLVPVISRVANGILPELTIFGGDYPTPDGTGIRDFIHVEDLANGHVLSLNALFSNERSHCVNLGTGRGYSVLEMVKAYEAVSGVEIPYTIAPRREGDVGICFADVTQAQEELGFVATRDLTQMCASNWRFSGRRNSIG